MTFLLALKFSSLEVKCGLTASFFIFFPVIWMIVLFFLLSLRSNLNINNEEMKKLLSARPLVACIARTLICSAICVTANAQLSTNPDKFLGNITTSGANVDYGKEAFHTLWNQITPENETKWSSIEGNSRGSFSFSGADKSANYAKKWGFPFKFHTLIWGSQYPSWMDKLSTAEQYKAIIEWFDKVKEHYPNLEIIDVVNEAIDGHAPAPYKAALGGNGRTGYDWIIKAFQLARERWPNAILVYNDFNTFTWQKSQFIELVRTLRDAGAPVDAYGCQSHDINDISLNDFKSAMNELQTALKMPMYSTEFDIGHTDDKKQETQYKNLIPVMWEADYCAGVTLWGYIYGHTWIDKKDANGNVIERGISGIIRENKENGKTVYTDRPAMKWLREYMATDKAKNAKSPYPGFKKEASLYITPASLKMAKGDKMPIWVAASLATKTIEKLELYEGTKLIATMTEAPYIAEYTSSTTGWKTLKAVVTATDGSTYERVGRVNVLSSTAMREPYNETLPELPGTINPAEFDKGASGVSYSNAPYNYTTRAASSTAKDGGWMEYTVDVKETGIYTMDIEVASQSEGLFHLVDNDFGNMKFLTDFITVPKTEGLDDYRILHTVMTMELTEGRHTLCLNIDKGGFKMKNIIFTRYNEDKTMTCTVSRTPATVMVGDKATITVKASSKTSTIAAVNVYANNLWIGTLTEAPYTLEYEPTSYGKQVITAMATDAEGKSKTSTPSTTTTLTVNPQRTPYSGIISIPGTIQAENYDKGGEGYSYHDSDTKNEGDANFRADEGIDIVKGNNGKAIGYTEVDEWIEYTVNVTQAGKYTCEAVVSSGTTGSKFTISRKKNGTTATLCTIDVPKTGDNDWSTYTTVTKDISTSLVAGEQIFRITIKGKQCNIDKLTFRLTQDTGINDVESDVNAEEGDQFSLSGQKVGADYRGIVIKNGRKVLKK